MMLRKLYFLLLFVSFAFVQSQAQMINPMEWSNSAGDISELSVGDEFTLTFSGTVEPGWHVYSAVPPKDMPQLGSFFGLDEGTKGVEVVGKLAEEGKPSTYFDDVFEVDITVYYDKVTFRQKLKITEENPHVEAFVSYQVCEEGRCVPGNTDLKLDIKTVKKQPKVEKGTLDAPVIPKVEKTDQEKAKNDAPQPAAKVVDPKEEKAEAPAPLEITPSTSGGSMVDAAHLSHQISPEGPWKAGDEITLTFTATIDAGYHVYSAIPPESPANLPTAFLLDESAQGVELLGEMEEEGKVIQKYDDTFETDVRYFHDEVIFRQKLKVTEDNPYLEGYLSYQVCDAGSCLPAKEDVQFGEKKAATDHAGTTAGDAGGASEDKPSGMLGYIIGGFILGLTSLLTPCIFPMIPLTVSFFTKREGKSRAAGIRDAIMYGLSIIVIYTGLVMILTLIFGATFIQEVSNSPAFNIFFAILLLVFALSFMGMFEITLPASWSTAVSKGGDKGGPLGIFLMALALVIVSFSCTGPIVGSALGLAVTGESYLTPTVTMLAYSTAMAIPFVLFAIFPQMLSSLPQSGGWLNAVKVTLGLIELAFVFYYVSRADLVMHWGLLDREIFIGAWVVIFGALGMYLMGKIQLPHDSPIERLSVPRFLMALGAFWFTLYLIPGLWGAPLSMLGGFIPSNTSDIGVLLQSSERGTVSNGTSTSNDICSYPDKISGHLSEDTPRGFCAFYDIDQAIEYARTVNKPVFVDFTGHTCANCRYLEKEMWPDPEIKKMITEDYVLVSLYTDDRKKLPEPQIAQNGKKLRTIGDYWLNYQVEEYVTNSQPYYALIDHSKKNLVPPTGFNPPLDKDAYKR
ncbi:MAG: protein-disulfide reductase DsbD domain-containing protein, partial [Bacteroidota bacterium]